jgi:Reverse transcriptase (RNA-dependent DNA polymerase)/Endonuclease-reverse transcriptase
MNINSNKHNNNSHTTTIISWNAQGLRGNIRKWIELQLVCDQYKPLMIAIQDHRLQRHHQHKLKGYNIIYINYHLINIVRQDINQSVIDLKQHNQCHMKKLYTSWLRIKLNYHNRQLLICNAYKLSNTTTVIEERIVMNQFAAKIEEVSNQFTYSNTVVIGDFNSHSLHWSDKSTPTGEELSMQFSSINLLNINHIFAHNHRTHTLGGVLDLAWCDDRHLVDDMNIKQGLLHSDHYPIMLKLNLMNQNHKMRRRLPTTWKINNADWSLYQTKLNQCLTDNNCIHFNIDSHSSDDVKQALIDEYTQVIIDSINSAAVEAVGKTSNIKKQYRHSDIWYHYPGVREAHLTMKHSHKLFSSSTTQSERSQHYQQFKSHQPQFIDIKQEACQNSWDNVLNEINNDASQRWKWMQRLNNKMNNTLKDFPPVNDKFNNTPCNSIESLNNINQHWIDISNRHSNSDPVVTLSDQYNEILAEQLSTFNIHQYQSLNINQPFQLQEVIDVCNIKYADTANGPDDVSAHFLKHATSLLHQSLHNLFNISWVNGIVPIQFKQAHVTAIHKGGNKSKSDANSYRPISVTSILARCMEKLIKYKLVEHLDANKFFCESQSGFRASRSTADCLFNVTEAMHDVIQQSKRRMPMLFLDITKAFDTVYRHGLIYKLLHHANLNGNSLKWINNFLTNRQCRTVHAISGQHSDWSTLNDGVPQGSVLAPILFIIFINDLAKKLSEHVNGSFFADDIVLWPKQQYDTDESIKDDNKKQSEEMRNAINIIEKWSKRWHVQFGMEKTQMMIVSQKPSTQHQHNQYTLNGNTIQYTNSYNYLGLILQSNGKWNKQFAKVKQRSNFAAHIVGKLISNKMAISLPVIRQLVLALVQSQTAYALPFWSPTDKQYLKLDSIIAKPVRRLLKLPFSAGIHSLLIESHILQTKYLRQKALFNWCTKLCQKPQQSPTITTNLLELKFNRSQRTLSHSSSFIQELNAIHNSYDVHYQNNQSLTNHKDLLNKLWTNIIEHWKTHTNVSNNIELLSIEQQNEYGLRKYIDIDKSINSYSRHYKIDKTNDATLRAKVRFDFIFGNDCKVSKFSSSTSKCTQCWNINDRIVDEDRKHMLIECSTYNDYREILYNELKQINNNLNINESIIGGELSSIKDKNQQKSVLQSTAQYIRKLYNKRRQLFYENQNNPEAYNTTVNIMNLVQTTRNLLNDAIQRISNKT